MKTISVILSLLFLSLALHAQSLVLVSPNGGATYAGGQQVSVSWIGDTAIPRVGIEYSLTHGDPWTQISSNEQHSGSLLWTVPYLMNSSAQVIVRATAIDISNPPSDVSDAPFTISAAAPDAYEPNNDMAHAYRLALGDTVRSALVISNMLYDTMGGPDTSRDDDYYSFDASAGTILSIRLTHVDSGKYGIPQINLFNASGLSVASGNTNLDYNCMVSGTYTCKIFTYNSWCKYNLRIMEGAASTIHLTSPNGGATYAAGQTIPVAWSSTGNINTVQLEYSLDNGVNWRWITSGSYGASDSIAWTAPYLKNSCMQGLVRVRAEGIGNPPSDVSDATFIISAAIPDAYEPNDDLAHAYRIALGDTVRNAFVISNMQSDTMGMDTSRDDDYFKFDASAGTLLSIRLNNVDSGMYGLPQINLFNASGISVAQGYSNLDYNCVVSGTYTIKIFTYGPWCTYNLRVTAGAPGTVHLSSPNNGDTVAAGQAIPVAWSATGNISSVQLDYSLDNGVNWREMAGSCYATGSRQWTAPYLKNGCAQALIRVCAEGISNPPSDVSDAPFTISAAIPDAYEPNDDLAHAYRIAISDTVRNALVMSNMAYDTMAGPDTLRDNDCFKFDASAGTLVSIRLSNADSGMFGLPQIALYGPDSAFMTQGYGRLAINILATGTYYCKISTWGLWCKYGLTVSSVTLLNVDSMTIDSASFDSLATDSTGANYTVNFASSITDFSMTLTLDSKVAGEINTASLPTGQIYSSPASGVQIKALSIDASAGISAALKYADIIIPYDVDSLNGIPETAMVVLWLNDSTGEWDPISFTLDTVHNLIIAHTTHFSIYGLFGTTEGTPVQATAVVPVAWMLSAYPNPANPDVRIRYSVPSTGFVNINIYSIAGKCITQLVRNPMEKGTYSVAWNGRDADGSGVASGVYLVRMTAGSRMMQKRIVLIR
ncbi:MAG: T9SS type A sorting domain-containing protein [Fibrobacterota bacterium]